MTAGTSKLAVAQSNDTSTIDGSANAIKLTEVYSEDALTGAVALTAGTLNLAQGATVQDAATNDLTGNMTDLDESNCYC